MLGRPEKQTLKKELKLIKTQVYEENTEVISSQRKKLKILKKFEIESKSLTIKKKGVKFIKFFKKLKNEISHYDWLRVVS